MKVWTDMITGEEFFSDAKVMDPVVWKDPETGEDVDTGLVRCAAQKQTQGGVHPVETWGVLQVQGGKGEEGVKGRSRR